MRLGLFMQPVHPLGRDLVATLAEDREAFILADRLGFSEGFMGNTSPTRPRTSPAH